MSGSFISPVILLLLCLAPLSVKVKVNADAKFIITTCKKAASSTSWYEVNYNFCVKTLQSVPASQYASNAGELALMTAELSLVLAKNTKTKLEALLAVSRDPTEKDVLRSCVGSYTQAIVASNSSVRAIRDGKMAEAMTELDTTNGRTQDCEVMYSEWVKRSPVAEEDEEEYELTLMAMAILSAV